MRELLEKLLSRTDLERDEARGLFQDLITGTLGEVRIAAVLAALRTKGETPAEIAGAAEALRANAAHFDAPPYPVADCCGTGGDGMGTLNASTAAALTAASCGLKVAKHGNRSVSSRCGSADVLEGCGIRIDGDAAFARRTLDEAGIGFLFAPRYHAGVRHAMPVRQALGVRTVFNLLGPLCNPARPAWQVVGVYDPRWCRPLAETLGMLGCQRALVVHGSGLDELALHDPTHCALFADGAVSEFDLEPEEAGVDRVPVKALAGGDAAANAAWLGELAAGRGSEAHLQWVAFNAGALLWTAGRAKDIVEGTRQAMDALRSGRPAQTLARWRELSADA